jgi:hypothetical protein
MYFVHAPVSSPRFSKSFPAEFPRTPSRRWYRIARSFVVGRHTGRSPGRLVQWLCQLGRTPGPALANAWEAVRCCSIFAWLAFLRRRGDRMSALAGGAGFDRSGRDGSYSRSSSLSQALFRSGPSNFFPTRFFEPSSRYPRRRCRTRRRSYRTLRHLVVLSLALCEPVHTAHTPKEHRTRTSSKG